MTKLTKAKTKRKYVHSPSYLQKKLTNQLSEYSARSLDNWTRDCLLYGTTESVVNPTRWYLFKLSVKNKIWSVRVSLAEWIGGGHLHDHCE